MKMRRTVSMVVALTCVLVFFSATTAMAQLYFSSMQGTWWVATKIMENGYLFTSPPADGATGKAKKWKEKTKVAYVYFPDDSLNGSVFENVTTVSADNGGGFDVSRDHVISIQGGTPYDFAAVEMMSGADYGFVLVLRVKLTEDSRRNLGHIKSGQISTIGGTRFDPFGGDRMFAAKLDYRFKWIPEHKVPTQIIDIVNGP